MAEMKGVAVAFECKSDLSELSPTHVLGEELCQKAGVKYEEVFTDAASMARMAQTIKREDGDVLCRLPFSVAVEAEQFGATLSLNPKTRLPAVRDFPHAKLDEIAELPPFDFAKGQMAAALSAAEMLAREGETVLFDMQGVFSILSMIVPSKEVYKALYRKGDRLRELAKTLKGHLAAYAREAAARGVKIIAYTGVAGLLQEPLRHRDAGRSTRHPRSSARCVASPLQRDLRRRRARGPVPFNGDGCASGDNLWRSASPRVGKSCRGGGRTRMPRTDAISAGGATHLQD